MGKTTAACYAVSNIRDYHVAACNDKGFIVYMQTWTAVSAIMACAQAQADMRRSGTEWHTVWAGDPARPDHMVTTKYGQTITSNEEER